MNIIPIYKQLDEYQTSACIAKAIRWNDLKRIKNEKFISVKDRTWVIKCVVISYHLCFARRLDVSFTDSTWIYYVLIFYHWAIETVMIKLHRMNYKVAKLRFARQSWSQSLDDVHTLKFRKLNFKRKNNCNVTMFMNI